jgi:hypothetical protein
VREKENFKYGDSVDIATIASKLDHFINEKTESLNNASQINLYSYLPRIYKKFGEAISKIPSFQTTNIFFAKE